MNDVYLRIEHKLDVLINYLHGMTNVPPADIPKQIPGGGGLTDGVCPITNTPISYTVDVVTGTPQRLDGLDTGMRHYADLSVPEVKSWDRARLTTMGNVENNNDDE